MFRYILHSNQQYNIILTSKMHAVESPKYNIIFKYMFVDIFVAHFADGIFKIILRYKNLCNSINILL